MRIISSIHTDDFNAHYANNDITEGGPSKAVADGR
jgi:hypothetical protein